MPSRPAKITAFDPTALHILNQAVREITGRLDDLQKQVPKRTILKATSKLVFGTVGAQSAVDATVFVNGAHTGGAASASPAQGVDIGSPNLIWSARVSAQNQVKVRVANPTGAGIAVKTIPWNVSIVQ